MTYLRFWLLCFWFAACTLSHTAFAAGHAAAEALFERGRELMSQGNYGEACKALEASQELETGIGTLLYLGACYEKQNRTASAWAAFREAWALAASRDDERAELAEERADALERRLDNVVVHVPEAHHVKGLEVRVDQQKIPSGSWGAPIPVDPGTRIFEATAPGHKPFRSTLTIAGDGSAYDIQVPLLERELKTEPKKAAAAATGSNQPPQIDSGQSDGSTQRSLAWSLGGAGIVAAVLGAGLGVQAKDKNDDSKSECPNSLELCTERGVEMREDARRYALGSNVAFAVAGGLLATGAVLFITAPVRRSPLAIRPTAHSRGAAVTIGGAF